KLAIFNFLIRKRNFYFKPLLQLSGRFGEGDIVKMDIVFLPGYYFFGVYAVLNMLIGNGIKGNLLIGCNCTQRLAAIGHTYFPPRNSNYHGMAVLIFFYIERRT